MSKRVYTVTMTETCETCQGQGKTHDDRWDIVYANLDDSPDAHYEQEVLKGWEAYHGYFVFQIDELPDEYPICPECEGAGKIVKEVELLSALRELKVAFSPDAFEGDPQELGYQAYEGKNTTILLPLPF
jgi:hypothetical protein